MAIPLSADKMLAALRTEGLTVHEHTGWKTHSRDAATGKSFGPVHGVLIHHTAGHGDKEICYSGRSDLPGPLCHAWLGKTTGLWMIGNGRANHAGMADAGVLSQVTAESYGDRPARPGPGTVDGNDVYYGLEIENLGNGKDPYPAAQYDQAVRWAAAICRVHGWGAKSVIGHKESTNQKIDPSFDMVEFRAAVAKRLTHPPDGPGQQETDAGEDPMPKYINLGVAEPYQLAPGQNWDAIEFTAEWTDETSDHANGGSVFVRGPARFTGEIGITAEGLPAGAQLQVRLSEVTTKDGHLQHDHAIAEVVGTEGGAFGKVPITGRVGAGRGMRVRLKAFEDTPVKITSAVLKALVWKES